MGWNDHIDWDLHHSIEEAESRGLIEKDTSEWLLAQDMINGVKSHDTLSPDDKAIWNTVVVPILTDLDEELEAEELAAKLSKDD